MSSIRHRKQSGSGSESTDGLLLHFEREDVGEAVDDAPPRCQSRECGPEQLVFKDQSAVDADDWKCAIFWFMSRKDGKLYP